MASLEVLLRLKKGLLEADPYSGLALEVGASYRSMPRETESKDVKLFFNMLESSVSRKGHLKCPQSTP